MATYDEERPMPKVVQPQYGLNDLAALDDKDHYSGFGKMILSKKPTEPKYGFGKAIREKQEKVYQSKQLVKTQFIGIWVIIKERLVLALSTMCMTR